MRPAIIDFPPPVQRPLRRFGAGLLINMFAAVLCARFRDHHIPEIGSLPSQFLAAKADAWMSGIPLPFQRSQFRFQIVYPASDLAHTRPETSEIGVNVVVLKQILIIKGQRSLRFSFLGNFSSADIDRDDETSVFLLLADSGAVMSSV